ncbi:hypothetical protein B0A50_07648 [Salinomyces thailandicus]|uniref:Acyltransferase 3 domain-containing protein n=1 Tax=Salinomyces thailandicus TaxID=706561 RepID=A0A4V5N392_9PEZI|nr:hypothetical protein B0A50_07648 [Salinomyces thailandica]
MGAEDDYPPGDFPHEEKPRSKWTSKASSLMPAVVANNMPQTIPTKHDDTQDYLLGTRGCLAIMGFLWVFLRTFAPAAVAHSANDTGPPAQIGLRKSLSVLFWNDTLIYNSIIFLSARMICLPFLLDPSKTTLASSVLRRGLRLWIPTAACLIVIWIAFSLNLGNQYLQDFADQTLNASMTSDLLVLDTHLKNFNAIFDLFWISHEFSYQAGNWAFPTQTLWIVSAIFQQSYTVYAAMVIIPYTRKSWRIIGAAFFIITAWWVYSWAWFSISGLLLADFVVDMDFRAKCQRHKLWAFGAAAALMAAGFLMQFLWVTAFPDLYTAEINYHTGLYNYGGVYTWRDFDTGEPQLRADDYLVIIGFHLLLETSSLARKIFSNPFFLFLGKRSFSYYLLQSIIVYTMGVKIVTNTIGDSLDGYTRASGISFIACLLVTLAAGEVFYQTIDRFSKWFAHKVFAWIRE